MGYEDAGEFKKTPNRRMPKILFVVLAVAAVVAEIALLYYVAYCVWMTAYPMADHMIWQRNFYLWLGVAALVGAAEFFLLKEFSRDRLIKLSRRLRSMIRADILRFSRLVLV